MKDSFQNAATLSPRLAAILCVVLLVLIWTVQAFVPVNYVITIATGVPLALGIWVRQVKFVWFMAVVIIAVTYLFFLFGPEVTFREALPVTLFNRTVSSIVTLCIAALVHAQIRGNESILQQRQQLEEQFQELEAINEELSQREQEIVRQNEELQSQAEELERQSEELRITNEDLIHWEKMQEHILELSRSLTANLSRDEIFTKICEALALLTPGKAAAVLEKYDQHLVVSCHHGFGPQGLQADRIPFGESFGSLVMALGQTGFLEDIRLRPDLTFLQPKTGTCCRSVLATPLRLQGRSIGTLEIYAHDVRPWAEAEIALAESLAAQASISLQNQELFTAIAQERRRFEAAFRNVPFGMAVADDPACAEVYFNPAAAAMFNVPVNENVGPATPMGAKLRQYIHRGDQRVPEDELPLARVVRGEDVLGDEFEIVLPGGKRLFILCCAAPVYDAQGQIAGGVVAFADITLQKTMQRELEIRRREAEEASLRKTHFLAAVSHDVRTPANAISLLAELIRREAADGGPMHEIADMAERLQANTHALIDLVGDVLDVARFDSGKIELVESEFSLSALVEEEVRQMQPLAKEKGIELRVASPPWPIWLRSDRVKLARVLGNLIGNAIKFTEQGYVEVSAALGTESDRRVLIRVTDTGVGIAPEHQAAIFDEFAQLNNPARDRAKGSGLGLAISHRLVEVMGGSIHVESRANEGSTFTVALPSSAIAMRLDAATRNAALDGRAAVNNHSRQPLNLRVLLVEDHQSTRESTARILRDEGIHVVEAEDGASARALMLEDSFDAILLDMMLPDLDGRELLKNLRVNRPPKLKGVLVLTGDLTAERLEEFKHLGADGLIGKPIDIGMLLASLRTFERD